VQHTQPLGGPGHRHVEVVAAARRSGEDRGGVGDAQRVDPRVQARDVPLLTADLTDRQRLSLSLDNPVARLPGEIAEKQSCLTWCPSAG
jgi:hypothetical protein